ncbi:MAG: RNA-directed DNA polymerase [Gallionellaceae bacterium]|nr:MAG: RNA-directed DNA polymerase [Gallionellaceae bacterium]
MKGGTVQTTAAEVSERAKQAADTPGRDWAWAEASVWTERMLSALGNGVKGGKWFSLMDKVTRPATLEAAWRKVAGNGGAAGVDRQSIERFAAKSGEYLGELSRALEERSYRPQPVRRVEIPKGDGKARPLGIPTVKDRIVQTALKLVLEPIFEARFLEGSYGFRPGKGCKGALREVDKLLKEGHTFVVDADLQSYFDSIPHGRLMRRVEERISDGAVLELIAGFLGQDIMQEGRRWAPEGGTPQGAVISPLLANIYLHPLDVLMKESGCRMVRYADDFVILCRSREEAAAALEKVRAWVQENGLTLHPDKTHIGDCRQTGEGFDFLGYRFEAGKRHVRKKSLQRLKEKVLEKTRRTRGDSLARIVGDLNQMLKGWFAYFKHAHGWTFGVLDAQIRRRLRAMLRKQEKRPGLGRCRADHQRWPNAFFAEAGLFAMHTAWLAARQSR